MDSCLRPLSSLKQNQMKGSHLVPSAALNQKQFSKTNVHLESTMTSNIQAVITELTKHTTD